ncbi:MAG: PHP domain-containing protein [Clostridia bacterium]|nr:PHP domain-containing protein [Clostridia bacterium]
MSRYYYDLHIHSCLSPCADDDMTPANIAGMASLKGLTLLALTDHNSCRNCPAFFEACKAFGIVPVPGMELTTAEDIHLVVLFPTLEQAMEFDREIHGHILPIRNRPDIFGNQRIVDSDDNLLEEEDLLLINATDLDVDSAIALVRRYGGALYPAHIDRPSNGMIAILGTVPAEYGFSCVEFNDISHRDAILAEHGLQRCKTLCSSDAHDLGRINEAEHFIELEDEPYSSALVRRRLIEHLTL